MDLRSLRTVFSLKSKTGTGYYIAMDSEHQIVVDLDSAHKKWKNDFFFIRGSIGDVPRTTGFPSKGPLNFYTSELLILLDQAFAN